MKRMVITMTIAALAATGVAGAHGGRGSYEGDPKHRTGKRYAKSQNNVRCAGGMRVAPAGASLYADPLVGPGAEFCKDAGPAPLQGRVIVARAGWAAIDGERDNVGPARGYARVDRRGPHCSQGKDQDATHSRTAGKPTTCNGS